jgi:hypothetical protein
MHNVQTHTIMNAILDSEQRDGCIDFTVTFHVAETQFAEFQFADYLFTCSQFADLLKNKSKYKFVMYKWLLIHCQ